MSHAVADRSPATAAQPISFKIYYGYAANDISNRVNQLIELDQSDASFNIGESGFTQGWPSTADDVTSIYLHAKDLDNSIFYPNAGVEFKIDLNPPALSTVTIASNNSTNNLYAKTGDQISITITGDEKLLGDHDHDWAGDGITYTGFNCSFSSFFCVTLNAISSSHFLKSGF